MSNSYEYLLIDIQFAMKQDDCDAADQSERLERLYLSADDAGKELLDQAFTCLCGWRLSTLLERTQTRQAFSS